MLREELAAPVRERRRLPSGRTLRARESQQGAASRLLRNNVARVSLLVIVSWVALGLTAPVLPIEDPNTVALERKLQSPLNHGPFGTDEVGRDILSRVIYGARVSIPAGLVVVAGSVIIGVIAGSIAGLSGGMAEQVIMRLCDAVLSFPAIILAMAVAVVRGGPGLENVILAVIIVLWPEYARVMRGEILSIKEREFVTAARTLGGSPWRVAIHHILPSANPPLVVKATLDVGGAILLTASLGFLGFGVVPPTPEWGFMVSEGARVGIRFWWCSAFAGLAIMSIVMALNFFGDALRDAIDPRATRTQRNR